MARATGVGSLPGEDQPAFAESLRWILGEFGAAESGVPYLPEVPGRGAPAGMIGRTLGLIGDLDADLQPIGWRLTGTSGAPAIDQRRARSLLAQDLDHLEEQAEGYEGDFKIQIAGPWTLAATVERPRGDKLLGDHGARRDLAQALAEAVSDHTADVRRRLPDVRRLIVQIDEPALPSVLAGQVPTASSFGRHRTVHPPEADQALRWVIDAVTAAGAAAWVHCCAADPPVALVRGAGATGVHVDLDLLDADGHDQVAETLDAGGIVALGVVPATDPTPMPSDRSVIERVRRWSDMLGLDLEGIGDRLVLAPSCGMAAASSSWSQRSMPLLTAAASRLLD